MKKNPKDFIQLEKEYYENAKEKKLSEKLCCYVWNVLISMSKGYGFNSSHTLAYSIVGIQEANLAYKYPIIYWNTANLISDSGGEDGGTDYGKIAIAIDHMKSEGIKIALPDINKAEYSFTPDVSNNQIIFGFKGMQGVGDAVAKAIVAHRPYDSMKDFYEKMQSFKEEAKENKFGDTSMIFLIKAGCFDRIENKDRREIMMNFIKIITPNLNSLRYTNIEDLNDLGFLTIEQQKNELRWFRFRQYIFDKKFFAGKKGKSATTEYYYLEPKFAEPYFRENFAPDMEEDSDYFYDDNNMFCVKRGSFDRVFKKKMENFKEEKLDNEEVLQKVYIKKVNQEWEDKKLNSTTAKWEMDSLSYYYGEHELAKVNRETYNISNFNDLSPKGEIAGWFYYKNQKKPRFALTRLCGTVVSKNKNKGSLALSTPDGVVTIKLYKGQFGFYDKQISEVDEDTSKKTVLEKSWFSRGTKLLITGYRRDDQFVAKKYNDSIYRHSIQFISSINDDGTLNLISERVGQEDE